MSATEESSVMHKNDVALSRTEQLISQFDKQDLNEVMSTYDVWAATYDADNDDSGYNGPQYVANKAMDLLGYNKDARIMDIAAGTGRIAKFLLEKGYTNIDGVDGSAGMRDVAMEKKLYKNYFVTFVTGDKTEGIEDNTYDCIVTCGSFVAGHLKVDVIPELIRITKPGGYVCICMREKWMYSVYKGELECVMYTCMEKKKWERIERQIVPRHIGDFEGLLFVYRKL